MPAISSSPTALADAAAAAGVPARPLSSTESISLLQALAAVPDRVGPGAVVTVCNQSSSSR